MCTQHTKHYFQMESANPPAEPVNPEGNQELAIKTDVEPSAKNDANDFAFSSDDEKASKRALNRSPSEEQKRSQHDRS